MKNLFLNPTLTNKRVVSLVATGILLILLALPLQALAANIDNRKVTLGSSAPEAVTTYTFTSNALPTSTAVQSVEAEVCTTSSGACSAPADFDGASAGIASQPSGLGAGSGWTDDSTAGSLRITNSSNSTAPSGSVTIPWNNVTNPSATNTTYYLRVTTFSDDAYTTPLDSGVIAVSTATQINLTGTMDESLVFCVGTTITSDDCTTATGSSVSFGTFSSTATRSATSKFAASTNSAYGYSVTNNGSTLTCATCPGTPTIAALASQTASATGQAQFGLNLRANTTPSVGSDKTGSGTGNPTANYNTQNQYRFGTGESVASVSGPSNPNTYTSSYIVNVPAIQQAGTYTATMTYIATATY